MARDGGRRDSGNRRRETPSSAARRHGYILRCVAAYTAAANATRLLSRP